MLLDAGTVVNGEEVIKEANKLIQAMENFIPTLLNFALNVLVAIILFVIGKLVIKLVLKFVKRFCERAKIEVSVRKFLESLVKFVLYIILLVIICDRVGIETTSFIAVLGSAGLALGLALQGSLSNFAGGVLILILKPFKVGDYILDGSSGKEGTVRKIDLFYTYLDTGDNKKLIIPNGNLSNTHLINTSANNKRRVDFDLGISYATDIDEAKRVILDTISKEDKVLKEEEIFVFIKELAASQVTVGVRIWAYSSDYRDVYFRLNENFKKAFDKAQIKIPLNRLSVHIEENK